MTVEAFFDTNVLVYAATGSGKDQTKREKAQKLISSLEFGTSAQVLQEFYVTTVKKAARPLPAADALQWIEQLSKLPCQPVDHRLVRIAIEYSGRYRLSYWDAAIVASAEALGARTLYSEDLNHGQFFGRLQVVNPFL